MIFNEKWDLVLKDELEKDLKDSEIIVILNENNTEYLTSYFLIYSIVNRVIANYFTS